MLVRVDIPIADQIVQVGHACLEAGRRYMGSDEAPNLVLLGLASERQLLDALGRLDVRGIGYAAFHEPDDQMGYTAVCTEPLSAERGSAFQRMRLWRQK